MLVWFARPYGDGVGKVGFHWVAGIVTTRFFTPATNSTAYGSFLIA